MHEKLTIPQNETRYHPKYAASGDGARLLRAISATSTTASAGTLRLQIVNVGSSCLSFFARFLLPLYFGNVTPDSFNRCFLDMVTFHRDNSPSHFRVRYDEILLALPCCRLLELNVSVDSCTQRALLGRMGSYNSVFGLANWSFERGHTHIVDVGKVGEVVYRRLPPSILSYLSTFRQKIVSVLSYCLWLPRATTW